MRLSERFCTSWFPMAITLFGVAAFVVWLWYDNSPALTPYGNEAPIEFQLQYERNRVLSRRINRGAVGTFAAGVVLLGAQGVCRLSRTRHARNHSVHSLSSGSGVGT